MDHEITLERQRLVALEMAVSLAEKGTISEHRIFEKADEFMEFLRCGTVPVCDD